MDESEPGEGPSPLLDPKAIAPLVELIGPPISQSEWSPNLVVQTLEILPLGLDGERLFWLKPVHADSLRVGLPREAQPGRHVLDALAWYPLTPRIVHSTSWRHEDGRIVLTYVAVIEPPAHLPHDSLIRLPVERTDLARGAAHRGPVLDRRDAGPRARPPPSVVARARRPGGVGGALRLARGPR